MAVTSPCDYRDEQDCILYCENYMHLYICILCMAHCGRIEDICKIGCETGCVVWTTLARMLKNRCIPYFLIDMTRSAIFQRIQDSKRHLSELISWHFCLVVLFLRNKKHPFVHSLHHYVHKPAMFLYLKR